MSSRRHWTYRRVLGYPTGSLPSPCLPRGLSSSWSSCGEWRALARQPISWPSSRMSCSLHCSARPSLWMVLSMASSSFCSPSGENCLIPPSGRRLLSSVSSRWPSALDRSLCLPPTIASIMAYTGETDREIVLILLSWIICFRDAMIVTTLDTLTSLLGGVTIFAILGNLAHNLQIENIRDVVRSGTGLAFISYPDAISKFQAVPQLFSVLFFFMLFVLGIGSIVALQSTIVTIICDQFKSWKYWKVALATSICGFLMGLVYVTPVSSLNGCITKSFNLFFIIFHSGRSMDSDLSWFLWRHLCGLSFGHFWAGGHCVDLR